MTQPTQAQIEAAAQAIFQQRFGRDWKQWDCKADAEAALTAAAQVGERTTFSTEDIAINVSIAVNATIERCAQVAEQRKPPERTYGEAQMGSHYAHHMDWREIAAAIRKLKDEP